MNYSQLSSEFTSKFFGLVNQANKIIITAHESPDEDSIASVLSVYDILSHRYPKKNIRIIYSSEPEDKFRIFKNYDKIEFEDHPWGFVITPKLNGDCGVSGRSLPKSVSVRDMMERMKLGGGHDRAAGGTFKKVGDDVNVKDCVGKVLSWIKNNKPVII